MFRSLSLSEDNQMELNSISTKMGYSVQQIEFEGPELSPTVVDTTDDSATGLKSPAAEVDMSSLFIPSSDTTAESCGPFCPCQCHKSTLLRSPLWFSGIFGTVVFSTNTTLSFDRPQCSMPHKCKRSGRLSTRISYFSP